MERRGVRVLILTCLVFCLVLWLSCGCLVVVLWLSCGCLAISCHAMSCLALPYLEVLLSCLALWMSCLVADLSWVVLSCGCIDHLSTLTLTLTPTLTLTLPCHASFLLVSSFCRDCLPLSVCLFLCLLLSSVVLPCLFFLTSNSNSNFILSLSLFLFPVEAEHWIFAYGSLINSKSRWSD